MKQLSLFIMFTIVMVISFCSCTENRQDTTTNMSKIRGINNTNECNSFECMSEIASEHEDLLGSNILIFETLDDAYDLIETLEEASYNEMNTIYSGWNINNPIMESLMAWKQVEELYTFADDMIESELPEYIDDIVELGPTYTQSSLIYDSTLLDEVTLIEPLGKYGLEILFNDSGYFIAENKLYINRADMGIIAYCPLDEIEDYFDYYHGQTDLLEYQENIFQRNDNDDEPWGYDKYLNPIDDGGSISSWWYNYSFSASTTYNGIIYRIVTTIRPNYNQFWFFGPWTQRCFNVTVANYIISNGVMIKTQRNILAQISFNVHDSEADYQTDISFTKTNKEEYTYRYKYDTVGGKESFYSGSNLHIFVTNGIVSINRNVP